MEIELHIEGGKYPVVIKTMLAKDGNLYYCSEYLGATISTFPSHKTFKGGSIEESLQLIATALKKAIEELLEQ